MAILNMAEFFASLFLCPFCLIFSLPASNQPAFVFNPWSQYHTVLHTTIGLVLLWSSLRNLEDGPSYIVTLTDVPWNRIISQTGRHLPSNITLRASKNRNRESADAICSIISLNMPSLYLQKENLIVPNTDGIAGRGVFSYHL